MPLARKLMGLQVRVGKPEKRGRRAGKVEEVLFHPNEPRAVGFLVSREILWTIKLKSRFVPWPADGEVADDAPLRAAKTLSLSAASRALGYDFESTVIWVGMPVRVLDGETIGAVRDVGLGRASGSVKRLLVSQGAITDAGAGRLEVPGAEVVGFADGAVVLRSGALDRADVTGGPAHLAGAAAGYTKVRVEQLGEAGGEFADGLNRAADKVIDEEKLAPHAKKLGYRAGSMLRKVKNAASDAMKDEE